MSTSTWSHLRNRLGNRAAVVLAGSIGFAIGGVSLAGALGGDDTASTPTEASASASDSTLVDNTVVDNTVDATVPDNTVVDSTTPGSTTPANALPAPFTKTYDSAGGSITVTWSGTSFSLDSVSAAAGYDVEIKDQRWDRIRVEFRGSDDSRVEVRLSDDDNTIRVGID